jgi:hypothetical protein
MAAYLLCISLSMYNDVLFVFSSAYLYGLAFISVLAFLYFRRFKRAFTFAPRWLRIFANVALTILTLILIEYVTEYVLFM